MADRGNGGYMPIENHGLIGNMRTCAMVAIDGSIDFMCWPHFDSPSVFARILDKDKGGHFSIRPVSRNNGSMSAKQQYLPSSNILQTRFLHQDGSINLTDFFPRPASVEVPIDGKVPSKGRDQLKRWLVRRVECVRGEVDVEMELLPAFNYARDSHGIVLSSKSYTERNATEMKHAHPLVRINSKSLSLQLEAIVDSHGDIDDRSEVHELAFECREGSQLGEMIVARFTLKEGQGVSFVLREQPDSGSYESADFITSAEVDLVQRQTQKFWFDWISQSRYKGRWREIVSRSLLILKMLVFEPTGAIVAAPTFSLPEAIGGGRNWDYRYCWVRDASFTIYILLRMGFKSEAEAYMHFMSDRIRFSRSPEGALPIMFSIHGDTDLPELELDHLEGYRGSRPVRIGNGAAFHKQFDIYGELMDGIYLYNKYGKPISYDEWVAVRELIDYVCTITHEKDMSIWEVRGEIQNFTYSKMLLWVALDRAIRLSDKRANLPAPNRTTWIQHRDALYEEIMQHGYNEKLGAFIQSYEHNETLDAAVLIAPLVFFIAPNDPRFTRTLDAILRPPDKGGLTSAGLVYRYDVTRSDDGVGGEEGFFSMCGFWLIEALTRAGAYDRKYLEKAVTKFEGLLGYANHLGLFAEEIGMDGTQLGNTPQAFSHLSLVSAAFNLDRAMDGGSHASS